MRATLPAPVVDWQPSFTGTFLYLCNDPRYARRAVPFNLWFSTERRCQLATTRKKPAQSFGPYYSSGSTIETAVWSNEIEAKGKTVKVFAVSVSRNFKDDDGTWKRRLRAFECKTYLCSTMLLGRPMIGSCLKSVRRTSPQMTPTSRNSRQRPVGTPEVD
jgi:hypothetical protein